MVGCADGDAEGVDEGASLGIDDGDGDGAGDSVGAAVGVAVGFAVCEGAPVGTSLGEGDGAGDSVGEAVGLGKESSSLRVLVEALSSTAAKAVAMANHLGTLPRLLESIATAHTASNTIGITLRFMFAVCRKRH